MAIYSGKDMPKEVGRTTMDFEVKNRLKDGPVLRQQVRERLSLKGMKFLP